MVANSTVIMFIAIIFATLLLSTDAQPIKFCRSEIIGGQQAFLDKFMQEGFIYWKEWVNARGGIKVGSIRRPIELRIMEGSSEETIQLNYQRLLGPIENCDFIFPPMGFARFGVKLMQMVETGIGSIDNFVTVKKLPYMYRHGGDASTLWQGRNWTWSFSMSPSEINRPRPCFNLYKENGAKSAWIIVSDFPDAIYNLTALAVQKLLTEYDINQTAIYRLQSNMTTADIQNFTLELAIANPDLVIFRLRFTSQLADLLKTMRGFANYQPKGIHVLGENQLINGTTLFRDVEWAVNHITTSGGWFPTDQYKDDYYGTALELASNMSARFPNSTINELHAAAATIGLLHVMAIEETGSLDPDRIKDFFLNFNRTISYGPTSWEFAGEFSSAAWRCMQTTSDQNVRVLTEENKLIYPAYAVAPPPPPKAKKSRRTLSLTISMSVIGGLLLILLIGLLISYFFLKKKFHLIFVKKNINDGEWTEN